MNVENNHVPTENTVQYFLYCRSEDPNTLNPDDRFKKLNDKIIDYYGYLAQYLTNYIWHNEPFSLKPIEHLTNSYIYGTTNFDENIEDEWFIVFLLRELTKFDKDLFVKVFDEDGEILLIESAQFLEKWAQDPNKTENRVFLFRGDVHLIPCKFESNHNTSSYDFIKEAINFIINNPDKTRCNNDIQQSINNRIDGYPQNIYTYQHNAHCYLPFKIVTILEHNPKLIAHAVRAFYYRTSDDQKAIISMKHFPPEKCVLSNVKFTRCLFAQLTSQEYIPDPRTGWKIPTKDSKNYNTHLNGIKVAAGFEILVCNYLKKKISINCVEENLDDSNKQWRKFFNCLQKHGYFENELEGSKLFCRKLDKCKLFFKQMFQIENNQFNLNDIESVGKEIYNYIENISIEEELIEKPLEPADDESWLHINPIELDRILSKKFGCSLNENVNEKEYSENIPSTVKNFVYNNNAGLEGAEPPKNKKVEMKKDCKTDRLNINEEEFDNFFKEINFLVENKAGISNILDDDSTDSSDMEEYDYEDLDNINNTNLHSKTNNDNCYEINAYMKQMDSELAKTLVGQSFTKCSHANEETDSDDDYSVKDIELNALSNILESHKNEVSTAAGPATVLFASMNTRLPDPEKE